MFRSKLLSSITTIGLLVAGMQSTIAAEKQILGVNETVYLADFDLQLDAKMDTGATTSSLSAKEIETFEKDDDSWVRFKLAIEDAPEDTYEFPVVRSSRIKRRAGDLTSKHKKTYSERPIIKLEVVIGKKTEKIEVNLTDRSAFKYPLLVSAKALTKLKFIIDPSEEFLAGEPNHDKESDD